MIALGIISVIVSVACAFCCGYGVGQDHARKRRDWRYRR